MFLSVACRAVWGIPKDVGRGSPQNVDTERSQDVGKVLPLTLHIGPYGYVFRTLVEYAFRKPVADVPWRYI